ncbi:hypothetical protein [Acuticoccus kandeliae]|uniref:hypothetical protein n=1 Tax=Acuticoccus kandeliae TaxID=2073160 RepID=UPI0013007EC2|nr:hypothetical protein [Acuticoccus kandeliae]
MSAGCADGCAGRDVVRGGEVAPGLSGALAEARPRRSPVRMGGAGYGNGREVADGVNGGSRVSPIADCATADATIVAEFPREPIPIRDAQARAHELFANGSSSRSSMAQTLSSAAHLGALNGWRVVRGTTHPPVGHAQVGKAPKLSLIGDMLAYSIDRVTAMAWNHEMVGIMRVSRSYDGEFVGGPDGGRAKPMGRDARHLTFADDPCAGAAGMLPPRLVDVAQDHRACLDGGRMLDGETVDAPPRLVVVRMCGSPSGTSAMRPQAVRLDACTAWVDGRDGAFSQTGRAREGRK